jgi:hypothetical protein
MDPLEATLGVGRKDKKQSHAWTQKQEQASNAWTQGAGQTGRICAGHATQASIGLSRIISSRFPYPLRMDKPNRKIHVFTDGDIRKFIPGRISDDQET